MPRVKPLDNLRAPIEEGYFSKLDSLVASRSWPGKFISTPSFWFHVDSINLENFNFLFYDTKITARSSGVTLRNLNRRSDQITLDISDMERMARNFTTAINQGYAEAANGQRIPLDDISGIDVLGDMMEASILTPNRTLYGDLHNFGHIIISVNCLCSLSMWTEF